MASAGGSGLPRGRVSAVAEFEAQSFEPRREPLWELQSGMVQEWVATSEGSGVLELALWNARQSLHGQSIIAGGRWLVVDTTLSPVAMVERGIDLSRVVAVQVHEPTELLWAVEQGLRSRGVDLVICRVDRLPTVAFRRWKLAAEVGGTRCLVLRGADALREAGWADLRVRVTPLCSPDWDKRRSRIETLKVRNGLPGGVIEVEWDRETDCLRVVSVLADSTSTPCAAGA